MNGGILNVLEKLLPNILGKDNFFDWTIELKGKVI